MSKKPSEKEEEYFARVEFERRKKNRTNLLRRRRKGYGSSII
jgi:hypothetical protein